MNSEALSNSRVEQSDSIGRFLKESFFLEANRLVQAQLSNPQVVGLDISYLKRFKYKDLELAHYFQNLIASDLFYSQKIHFHVVKYLIPKNVNGVRELRLMTLPLQTLYYAVVLYITRIGQSVLDFIKQDRSAVAFYGGSLEFEAKSDRLNLEKSSAYYYKPHYKKFTKVLKEEMKLDTTVLSFDIQDFFNDLDIDKLMSLLNQFANPNETRLYKFDAQTRASILFFFRFIMDGQRGIPQGPNNVASNYLGNIFLTFGDIFIGDLLKSKGYSYKIIRYMDDYRIVIHQILSGNDCLALIQMVEELLYIKLGLHLNPRKTSFSQINSIDDIEELTNRLKLVSLARKKHDSNTALDFVETLRSVVQAQQNFMDLQQLKSSASTKLNVINSRGLPEEIQKLHSADVQALLNQLCLPTIAINSRALVRVFQLFPVAHLELYAKLKNRNGIFERAILAEFKLFETSNCSVKGNGIIEKTPLQQFFSKKKIIINDRWIIGARSLDYPPEFVGTQFIDQFKRLRMAIIVSDHSSALNYLLNLLHYTVFIYDTKGNKNANRYNAEDVLLFLRNNDITMKQRIIVRNLFQRRNKSPLSHPGLELPSWEINEREFWHYHSIVISVLEDIFQQNKTIPVPATPSP